MTALPALETESGTEDEVFAAVGRIILEHAHLSQSLFLFFLQYLDLPGNTPLVLFDTLNNRDRVDLIKRLVAAGDPAPGDEEAIVHILRCYDICTENRNIIAHCSYLGRRAEGYLLHKHPTGTTRTSWDLCLPVTALQEAAWDTYNMSGHIMLVWHALVDRGTPEERPLPQKPPQPRKLSLFRLPEARADEQPPPRS